MAALGESGPDASSDDPFARLGLSRDAGFEQVQAAKVRCLAEVSGDDQAKITAKPTPHKSRKDACRREETKQ